MKPIHPEVHVKLAGESAHPLFIMGRSVAAMRGAGLGEGERLAFLEEATSGNYADLLQTVRRWFSVD